MLTVQHVWKECSTSAFFCDSWGTMWFNRWIGWHDLSFQFFPSGSQPGREQGTDTSPPLWSLPHCSLTSTMWARLGAQGLRESFYCTFNLPYIKSGFFWEAISLFSKYLNCGVTFFSSVKRKWEEGKLSLGLDGENSRKYKWLQRQIILRKRYQEASCLSSQLSQRHTISVWAKRYLFFSWDRTTMQSLCVWIYHCKHLESGIICFSF